MIKLEFGEFAVNMGDAVALDAALLADFGSNGFDLLDPPSSNSGQLNYDVQGGGNSARIHMVGNFHFPPVPADTVDILEIFNHEDVALRGSGTSRLIVSGPPALTFGAVFDDFLNTSEVRDISVLYAGQQVEIHGSNGFGDTLVGDALGDSLFGEGGADLLFGMEGNDTLNGGAGNDSMAGGAGNDIYFVNARTDVVSDEGGVADTVKSAVTLTLVSGIERLTLTGTKALNGTGNASANLLTGNAGINTLDGGVGADTLNGAGGNDKLIWSAADFFNGGAGNADMLFVKGGGALLNLQAAPPSKATGIEVISLTGTGNNALFLSVDDVLSSNTDTLRIMGNAGDSVHRGSNWTAGANQVIGGQIYRVYTKGLATLLVDTDITSVV